MKKENVDKYQEFRRKLFGVDESKTESGKISNFTQRLQSMLDYDEYEPGDEPSNNDLLTEIGDLCNEFDMSAADIKTVLDSGELNSNFHLNIVYEETLDYENSKSNKTENKCAKESKLFAEWLRSNCVISEDEGFFYDDTIYDIDAIYDIYTNNVF